jgi:hypothetical protein
LTLKLEAEASESIVEFTHNPGFTSEEFRLLSDE